MVRATPLDQRQVAALERIAGALEKIAVERDGLFILSEDGVPAIPNPVSSQEIAARTQPVTTTPGKRYGGHWVEENKPLPPETRGLHSIDDIPSDEVEPMNDND